MGGFQRSTRETFTTKTRNASQPLVSENPILTEKLGPEFEEVTANNSNELRIESLASEIKHYPVSVNRIRNNSKIQTSQIAGETTISEKSTEKVNLKPIKRNPVFNDSLKIGLVFLLIASALAFVPALLQLAVLFAVVAMVFLFIGLKKLFNRRAKIKKKKIRKENNQIRKEKIKDIFKK
ncbi:phage holin family protein [Lacihabitans soyangensis]|uniref:Uncharacterized protein n=1 Tax=Lacihabitans soyangensis TaxID=869394 RepID=A0AAE3H5L0_9BACT|nr:phage holin family protein [Lacihabitans soyangensis]MCP9765332.1 hypothetical protein [Lacihabitans soyangensis]